LDELKVTKITLKLKDELEKYKALKRLSMIACDLRSLDNFPNLASLEELELADNKIKGDELSKLPALNNLRSLGLSSNLINGVQDLKSLTKFNKII
jgi:Leucine-rich repeat (LRR) protein